MTASIQALLLFVVLVAGFYDLRWRRIPNWLTLAGLAAGFGVNTFGLATEGLGFDPGGLKNAALGFALALAVYLPLFLVRGMGAGDVKLMAAIGAIVGPGNWFSIFLVTALLGGVVSLILIAWKKRVRVTMSNVCVLVSEVSRLRSPADADPQLDVRNSQSLRMPHGTVIAAGALIVLAAGWRHIALSV